METMELDNQATQILIKLGFTQLESDIYSYLLTHGATTGYGIAKGVSKPAANVYKAIEGLVNKGAVEQTSGDKKKCIAVPWQQLMASQQRQFNSDMDTLRQAFQNLPTQQSEEEVYQLKNINQLRDSWCALINLSTQIVLADIEPQVVDLLKQPLIEAAARGVEVMVKVYEPVELPGVNVILRQDGKQVYDKTADRQVTVCADGKAMIVAMLSPDMKHIIQAFKTASPLMSITVYFKLLYEFILTQLKEAIPAGDIDKAQKILRDTQHLHPFSSENSVYSHFKKSYESWREARSTGCNLGRLSNQH